MLAPINIAARFGAHPDLDKVDVHVRQVMPKGLDELAVKRRFPIIVGGSILATLASWALGASSRWSAGAPPRDSACASSS